MSSSLDCHVCTETANENYTLHTGRLFACRQGESAARDLGNIAELTFRFAPEFLEHFAGDTGQLDAKIPIRKRFYLDGTLEELTPANMALLIGESQVPNTPSGCIIPLRRFQSCDAAIAAVEFVHTFPCGDKTVTIRFWRAAITTEAELTFGADSLVQIPLSFEALDCSSLHPDSPYGEIEFSEACALS